MAAATAAIAVFTASAAEKVCLECSVSVKLCRNPMTRADEAGCMAGAVLWCVVLCWNDFLCWRKFCSAAYGWHACDNMVGLGLLQRNVVSRGIGSECECECEWYRPNRILKSEFDYRLAHSSAVLCIDVVARALAETTRMHCIVIVLHPFPSIQRCPEK